MKTAEGETPYNLDATVFSQCPEDIFLLLFSAAASVYCFVRLIALVTLFNNENLMKLAHLYRIHGKLLDFVEGA